MKKLRLLPMAMIALVAANMNAFAQGRGGRGGAPAPPQTAKAGAPIDLTGYWVSVVTEDWRYRMVAPTKGDYQGVPMTPEARKIADSWDPAKEEASGELCKSYGATALLRVPGRLHITWQDDQTLRMDSDAGKQTRVFHFASSAAAALASVPSPGPHTLQGDSVAVWEGGGRGATDGSMKVTTSNLKGGFLRKNGVPYSDNASLTEYFELITEPKGTPLMVVTIVTTDPAYLRQPFVISSQFKKETSDAKWNPTACSATW